MASDGPLCVTTASETSRGAVDPRGRDEDGREAPLVSAALPGRDAAGEGKEGDLSLMEAEPSGASASSRPPLRGRLKPAPGCETDAGPPSPLDGPPRIGDAAPRSGRGDLGAAVGLGSRILRAVDEG